ncbi:MAG: aminotransferase class I/II-fold pyridoxal phosphate-dependent enzyme [Firmicutes bacterium]|nr:aminotransferase class I/II-fold pyridoxal phosphate-dependent enzyme [Bacillota bacterium]
MRLSPFLLERWFAKYEFEVKYNLCASCASSTNTAELLHLAGENAANEYLHLDLDYTQNPGNPRLRKEISRLYQNQQPEDIQVTIGASEAIYLLMNCLVQPGDNIVVQYPIYQSLFEVASSIGAEVRCWHLDENFNLDLDKLPQLIDEQTKMVVVNYPHSPTGAMISIEQQQRLIQIIEKNDCYLISDEVYAGIVYNPTHELPRAADLSSLAVSIGDLTKPWGLGGLRVGWLASKQPELLEKCSAMRDYTTMCNAAPAEYLSSIAVQYSEEILPQKIELARQNIKTWQQFCEQHPGVFSWIPPKGGFTAFPKIELDVNVDNFCRKLAEEYSVLLMPGSTFGSDQHIRIGFGNNSTQFEEGLELFSKFINSYRKI